MYLWRGDAGQADGCVFAFFMFFFAFGFSIDEELCRTSERLARQKGSGTPRLWGNTVKQSSAVQSLFRVDSDSCRVNNRLRYGVQQRERSEVLGV